MRTQSFRNVLTFLYSPQISLKDKKSRRMPHPSVSCLFSYSIIILNHVLIVQQMLSLVNALVELTWCGMCRKCSCPKWQNVFWIFFIVHTYLKYFQKKKVVFWLLHGKPYTADIIVFIICKGKKNNTNEYSKPSHKQYNNYCKNELAFYHTMNTEPNSHLS